MAAGERTGIDTELSERVNLSHDAVIHAHLLGHCITEAASLALKSDACLHHTRDIHRSFSREVATTENSFDSRKHSRRIVVECEHCSHVGLRDSRSERFHLRRVAEEHRNDILTCGSEGVEGVYLIFRVAGDGEKHCVEEFCAMDSARLHIGIAASITEHLLRCAEAAHHADLILGEVAERNHIVHILEERHRCVPETIAERLRTRVVEKIQSGYRIDRSETM